MSPTPNLQNLCDVAQRLYDQMIPGDTRDPSLYVTRINLQNGLNMQRLGVQPRFDLYDLAAGVVKVALTSSQPEDLGAIARDLLAADPVVADHLKAAMMLEKYRCDCPEGIREIELATVMLNIKNDLGIYAATGRKPTFDQATSRKLAEVVGFYRHEPKKDSLRLCEGSDRITVI